ncbi:MAG: alkaline phosphatase family protein, partial [Chlamydiota bacterium]
MINTSSLDALKKAQWTPHFIKPLYDSYSFSLIPPTIAKLLTGHGTSHLPVDAVGGSWKQYDCVVLFLIDGFGWEFFNAYAHKYPFLDRFSKEGVASKISSQFPSTTAAHVTTMNTGMEVGQTGIYEWFYYEPVVDEMISPLVFSYSGDHTVATLLKSGYRPEKIFPFKTIYQQLADHGVKSIAMQHEDIAHSPYSSALLAGAQNIPFAHFDDALKRLVDICEGPHEQPT